MGATLTSVRESGSASFAEGEGDGEREREQRGKRGRFEQSVNRLSGALREVNSETKRRCGPPAALGRP